MKSFRYILLGVISSIVITNTLAFNTVNNTNMWLQIEGDRGSYKETVPPNTTSNGWQMAAETNYPDITLKVMWGSKTTEGLIQPIGGYAWCTVPASGQQVVSGQCEMVVQGGYYVCKGQQQKPTVSCGL